MKLGKYLLCSGSSSSGSRGSSSRFYDGDGEAYSVSDRAQGTDLRVGDRVCWLREKEGKEFGTVRWIGVIHEEEIAGVEFDNCLGLGSGWYKNCLLFECKPNHGGLVAVVGLIREKDFLREMPLIADTYVIHRPLREDDVERIAGRPKGIQGHRNSCYLDATLFSMFSFSGVFDCILFNCNWNEKPGIDLPTANEVVQILREDIVNPLRKDLFTSADNVMALREVMLHLDNKLTTEEMDPQEFLEILFRKILSLDGFVSLSSGHSDFFYQVFCVGDTEKIPTVQQVLEESLFQDGLKFKTIPSPALIVQMPRSGNKFKVFKGILPNLTIDITDLLQDTPRTCFICGSLATYECPECYGKFKEHPHSSGAESTPFCTDCVQRAHARPDRKSHKYNALNLDAIKDFFPTRQGVPTGAKIPRVTMDLFAVICIETSHFVSFVKCGNDRNAPWVFCDSMADRIENMNGTGHNVPEVRVLPQMGVWLDHLEKTPSLLPDALDTVTPELKRLLSDPYICFYQSSTQSMYA